MGFVNVDGKWYNTLADYELLKETIEGRVQGINTLFGRHVDEVNDFIKENDIEPIPIQGIRSRFASIAVAINDMANKIKPYHIGFDLDELPYHCYQDKDSLAKMRNATELLEQKFIELFAIALATSGYQLEKIDENDKDYLSDICRDRRSRIVKFQYKDEGDSNESQNR